MRRYKRASLAAVFAAALAVSGSPPAGALEESELAVGLGDDNELVVMDGAGNVAGSDTVTGLQSGDELVSIDFRPANGELYGLGSLGNLYMIDGETNEATRIGSAPLSPLPTGTVDIDFNPVADRLRVVTTDDQNLRVNVDTGAAIVDGTLEYAEGDDNEAENPNIVAAAYTNSVAGNTSTSLFNIDSTLNTLTLQQPPNDGTQVSIAELSAPVGATVAMDIGRYNQATLLTNDGTDSTLHDLDLASGEVTELGVIEGTVLNDIAISPDAPLGSGYTLAALDGGVFNYGTSTFEGSKGGQSLNAPIIDVANHTGSGYWMTALDGGVFNYGDAEFFGSAGSLTLNEPVVGIAKTPTDQGYWLVAADGGVFAYGDAQFFGSAGSLTLNAPVVAIAPTVTGNGYWLVAADGGVFAYGDAQFYGSAGGIDLNEQVVSGASSTTGNGYYLFAEDGGVFAYGDAQFRGSAGSLDLNEPVVDGAVSEDGSGYWLAAADGGVFSYGSRFHGSAGSENLNSPVIAIAGK